MSRTIIAHLSVVAAFLATTNPAGAQSGSRQSAQPGGAVAKAPVALGGYCPVCLLNMKKWVAGKPEYSVTYDGHVYRFPGREQMEMFQADPAKYTPVLHGDCVVCLAKMGKRVPGSLNFAQIHGGRIYLFPAEEQRAMFRSDPAKYADLDLALGGNCAVCRVEMGKEVKGKPEFATHHNGIRYLFPGPEQRKMFLANPQKYAIKPTEGSGPAEGPHSFNHGDSSNERTVTVRGRTGCAGCDYGIKPIEDADELGLAVVTDAGRLYVVEGAHRLYPGLYESRFEAREVTLTGQVIREEGRVAWVRPVSLNPVH